MLNAPEKTRYKIEAAVLCGLCLIVFLPWGCSKSPLAPGVAVVESTFVLPNGVIAYPGVKLSETEFASPDSALTVPVQNELDPQDTSTTSLPKNVANYGTYEEEIDAAGGSVNMDLEGEPSYFYVPRDALDEPTSIRVDVFRDLSQVEYVSTEFHFGPKGLTFNKASQLVFPTSTKEGEILELLWWDSARRKWMRSAEAIVVSGYATFPITHFSKYRTTERISLGGQGKKK